MDVLVNRWVGGRLSRYVDIMLKLTIITNCFCVLSSRITCAEFILSTLFFCVNCMATH